MVMDVSFASGVVHAALSARESLAILNGVYSMPRESFGILGGGGMMEGILIKY